MPREAQHGSRHWTLVAGALMLLVEFLFVAGLVSGAWARKVCATETAWRRELLGDRALQVEARARRWFEAAFVATGLVAASHDLLLPRETDLRDARGLEPVGRSRLFAFVAERLAVAWGMVELALERLASLLLWWPLAALAMAAALADARLRRSRRAFGFTPPDPLRHRLAAEGLRVLGWGVLYGLLVPWPLPAVSEVVVVIAGTALSHGLFVNR